MLLAVDFQPYLLKLQTLCRCKLSYTLTICSSSCPIFLSVGLLGGTALHPKITAVVLLVLVTTVLSVKSQLRLNTENKLSHSIALLHFHFKWKI